MEYPFAVAQGSSTVRRRSLCRPAPDIVLGMNGALLRDAFGHHVWASLRLLDACQGLTAEQLGTPVPGTYGSILDTARHLVASDAGYLAVVTGGRTQRVDADEMDMAELRAEMATHASAWSGLLEGDIDPAADFVRKQDDGSESHAPLGIRLAQALHHGTDHRSQICTALTTLGIDPPLIDVWDFGEQDGRL